MATKKKTTKEAEVQKEPTKIVIPGLNKQIVQLRLVGTDILVTKNGSELAQKLEDERSKVKAGGKKTPPPFDPHKQYMESRYIIDDETDGFPAFRIKEAIIHAAHTFAPVTRALIKGAVYVLPKFNNYLVPIECSVFPPPMRRDIEQVGKTTKSPDLRYRPEYRNWSIPIDVQFTADLIDVPNLVNLFAKAGFHIGIGEHRPYKGGGTWGRFEVMFEEEWLKYGMNGQKAA